MIKNKFAWMAWLMLALLSGCNGGDGGGGTSASSLSGVAAVGYPIVGGTVNISCASGSALTTTTSSTGGWQVTVSGQTLPCAVQVSGGTFNGAANTTFYHSIATALGTVNVTPLTDLMVANLANTATLNTWFAGLNSATLTAITQTNVDAALANLRTALGLTPLNAINPITTVFTAIPGDISDDMLAALSAAMTSASVTYASLLSNASATAFVAPAGFGTALTAAYASTTSGGSGGGGGGGSAGSAIGTGLYTAVLPADNVSFLALLNTACTTRTVISGATEYSNCTESTASNATNLVLQMWLGGLPHQTGGNIVSGPSSGSSAKITSNSGMAGVAVNNSCTAAIAEPYIPIIQIQANGSNYFAYSFSFNGTANDTISVLDSGVVDQYTMTDGHGDKIEVHPNLALYGSGSGAEAAVGNIDGSGNWTTYFMCTQ